MTKNNKLKGNKGEWGEVYVFLKTLLEDEIELGDESSDISRKIKVLGVIRPENPHIYKLESNQNDEMVIRLYNKTTHKLEHETDITKEQLRSISERMYSELKKAGKASDLDFSWLKPELKKLKIKTLKSNAANKQDIRLLINEQGTNKEQEYAFSIKTEIGNPATLFNASNLSKFYYKIVGDTSKLTPEIIESINSISGRNKYQKKIQLLEMMGFKLEYDQKQTKCGEINPTSNSQIKTSLISNLRGVNSVLPEVISKALYISFRHNIKDTKNIIQLLNKLDPDEEEVKNINYYDRIFESFYIDSSRGLKSKSIYNGKENKDIDASGGFLVLDKNGRLACYKNDGKGGEENLKNYLVNHTKFETPSTAGGSRPFGKIESSTTTEENGNITTQFYFSLNLQVRFTKGQPKKYTAFLQQLKTYKEQNIQDRIEQIYHNHTYDIVEYNNNLFSLIGYTEEKQKKPKMG